MENRENMNLRMGIEKRHLIQGIREVQSKEGNPKRTI